MKESEKIVCSRIFSFSLQFLFCIVPGNVKKYEHWRFDKKTFRKYNPLGRSLVIIELNDGFYFRVHTREAIH
jgi:hypothetical protein